MATKAGMFNPMTKATRRNDLLIFTTPRENDIIIVVMGTNAHVGPGFTANPQRLNVLLTRARCGLVIVGDLSSVEGAQCEGSKTKMMIEKETGEIAFVKANALFGMHKILERDGRVATLTRASKSVPMPPPSPPKGPGKGPARGPAGNMPRAPGPPRGKTSLVFRKS